MGQEAEFPIRLLDIAVRACGLDLLQTQDLIESRCRTSLDPEDSGLLLDRIRATCATVMVLTVFGVAVGMGVRTARFGGHGWWARGHAGLMKAKV